MKLPEVQREPCEVHVFHPHDHGQVTPGAKVCSGRFWCTACRRWLDGDKCKPGVSKAA